MRQGIVGGLLIFVGVIFSPFGPQFLDGIKTLLFVIYSGALSVGEYVLAIALAHGAYSKFTIAFLAIFWAVALFWAAVLMVMALCFAVKAARIFALSTAEGALADFRAVFLKLCFSVAALLFCSLFLYLASMIGIVIGEGIAKPVFLAGNTYNSLFASSLKWYLYACSVFVFIAGLFLIKDSCKKLAQNILRGI